MTLRKRRWLASALVSCCCTIFGSEASLQASGPCNCRQGCPHGECLEEGGSYFRDSESEDGQVPQPQADNLQLDETFAAFSGDSFAVAAMAPNMIGDFMGTATTSSVPLARGFIFANDVNFSSLGAPPNYYSSSSGSLIFFTGPVGPVPLYSGSPSRPSQSQRDTFADAANAPAVFGFQQIATLPSIPSGFTMVLPISQSQFNDIADGDGIVNGVFVNPDLTSEVGQAFSSAVGAGGTAVFHPDQSFAVVETGSGDDTGVVLQYSYVSSIAIPSPSAGAVVGRVRWSDNNSALPQNRLFFDYSYFHNVPFTASGVDVNRFTPGLESTFGDPDGLIYGSVELRVPMATTIDSTITADGGTDLSNAEFGNIGLATKLLLFERGPWTTAMGIGVLLPTADDVNVVLSNGSELVRVDNDSVHLTPYLAALYYGNNGYFAHTFLQLDIDTNGNDVFVNADGTGLTRAGSWNDQTLLAVDVGLGRWMYRNAQSRALSGLAWHSELHYTNSVTDADYIRQGAFVIGDPNSDLDLLNATVGATAEFAQVTRLTAGYSLPLTSSDRVFDGEFRLFVNRYW